MFDYTSGSTPEDEPPEEELGEQQPPEGELAKEKPASPQPPAPVQPEPKRERGLRTLWTVGSILSILLNVFLCLFLLVVGNRLFTIKKAIGVDVLGEMAVNFISLDQAHIRTTIDVEKQIPVQFDLPINQDTQVTTTQPTYVNGATVDLTTGGLIIHNAPANLVLPAGTPLQVHLNMTVPVQTTIPVQLTVPVDIPIQQTELHQPLQGLQQIAATYYWLLKPDWAGCQDVPLFSHLGPLCKLFFRGP